MENRKYLIIKKSETSLVDFESIASTGNFLPTSKNDEKVIIKWDSLEDPSFIKDFSWKEGPYNNEEITQIMGLPEWIIE